MPRRPEPSWVLVALALLPLVVDSCRATRPLSPPPALPVAAGGVVGRDVELTPSERALLERVPAAKRMYLVEGRAVVALAIDALVDRHVIHDPTYCLTGKGWHIVQDEERVLAAGPVRLLAAVEPGGRRVRSLVCFFQRGPVRYSSRWTYLGDFLHARWWPGASEPVRHVTLVSLERDGPQSDWLLETALPALFPPPSAVGRR